MRSNEAQLYHFPCKTYLEIFLQFFFDDTFWNGPNPFLYLPPQNRLMHGKIMVMIDVR